MEVCPTHLDVGVQVEESQLDLRNLPTMPTMLPGASSTADDDAELAGVHGSSSTATGTQLTRPSPHPRRSGGASPWLVGDDAAHGVEAGGRFQPPEILAVEAAGGVEQLGARLAQRAERMFQ